GASGRPPRRPRRGRTPGGPRASTSHAPSTAPTYAPAASAPGRPSDAGAPTLLRPPDERREHLEERVRRRRRRHRGGGPREGDDRGDREPGHPREGSGLRRDREPAAPRCRAGEGDSDDRGDPPRARREDARERPGLHEGRPRDSDRQPLGTATPRRGTFSPRLRDEPITLPSAFLRDRDDPRKRGCPQGARFSG